MGPGGSLAFDLAGRSLANNVSPVLQASLTQYGKDALDINIDVCTVFSGALCPLPSFAFSQAAIYSLEGQDISLPGIAYHIPNLEASLRVLVVDQNTGNEAACLDVALSNGWTTAYPGVQWALGGIAIAAFGAAILHAFFPLSPARAGPEWRFWTIWQFYQFVASCGYLSLNYPALYQVFTLNFGAQRAWMPALRTQTGRWA